MAGDAAVLVEPPDAARLGDAMLRTLEDATLREHLAAAGPMRAAQFDWDTVASRVRAVLDRAAPR